MALFASAIFYIFLFGIYIANADISLGPVFNCLAPIFKAHASKIVKKRTFLSHGNVCVYSIHAQLYLERLPLIEAAFSSLNITDKRMYLVNSFDARELTWSVLNCLHTETPASLKLISESFSKEMEKFEGIAKARFIMQSCLLKHLHAMYNFIHHTNCEISIILEDDAVLHNYTPSVIQDMLLLSKDRSTFFNLGTCIDGKNFATCFNMVNQHFCRSDPKSATSCTTAYGYNKLYALENLNKMTAERHLKSPYIDERVVPADHWLNRVNSDFNVNVYSMPNAMAQPAKVTQKNDANYT